MFYKKKLREIEIEVVTLRLEVRKLKKSIKILQQNLELECDRADNVSKERNELREELKNCKEFLLITANRTRNTAYELDKFNEEINEEE